MGGNLVGLGIVRRLLHGTEVPDLVFRAPEYTINSAPKTGEAPYKITYIKELPAVSSGT